MFGSLTAVRMMVLVAKAGKSECTVKSQNMCLCVLGCLVMSDSLQHHGLQPTRLLCPWDFSGKSTGVGCHFPPPGDLPNPEIKPVSLALEAYSFSAEPLGKPIIKLT